MLQDSDQPGNLVFHPNDVLREMSVPINDIDGFVVALSNVMTSTMLAAKGIGLAAPQIGLPVRVIVVAASHDPDDLPITMINPEIVWKSSTVSVHKEGCLSIPGIRADIARPNRVQATFLDLDGKKHGITAEGLLAKCIQHEVDHLDGKLIIDLIPEDEKHRLMKSYSGMAGAKPIRVDALD